MVLAATREIAELADRYLVVEPELMVAIGSHLRARQALWTVEAILLHQHATSAFFPTARQRLGSTLGPLTVWTGLGAWTFDASCTKSSSTTA